MVTNILPARPEKEKNSFFAGKYRPRRQKTIASRQAATGVKTQAQKILAVSPQTIRDLTPAERAPPTKPPVTAWEVETGNRRPVQIRTVSPAAARAEKAINWAKTAGKTGRGKIP